MQELLHEYEPRGAGAELFRRRDSEVLLSGPAGTGKSRACLEKLHMMALLNPGMRGLIVRKTMASLGSTALVTWKRFVIAEAILVGEVEPFGGSTQEAAGFRYRNGSFIAIGGMDKSSKIMSSEYDVVYVQEATELTLDDWEAITTRLRNGRISFQQIIADCNPDTPTHWLKLRSDESVVRILESRHEDNPILYTKDGAITDTGVAYIKKLDALTGVRHLRLRKGQWAAAEGLVYEEWDSSIHLVDRFDIPWEWPRFWSIDFGFTNPMVIQCWAEDPDGRLFLYREWYHTRKTTDQHARGILSVVTDDKGVWLEPKPQAIICDHDAEGRVVLQRELGLSTRPAMKKRQEGIQAVQRRFRHEEDGKARLFFMRDSLVQRDPELSSARKPTSTSEEVMGYTWDTGSGKVIKEEPRKEDDHGMDAMRYLVAYRDLGPRPNVRWL